MSHFETHTWECDNCGFQWPVTTNVRERNPFMRPPQWGHILADPQSGVQKDLCGSCLSRALEALNG